MLGKNRSSYDMLQQIVEGCRNPIGKTDLYYKMGTQFSIFERWLNTAIRFRLIEHQKEVYKTTPKGIAWLTAWQAQQAFLTEKVVTNYFSEETIP